jgi:hypothetical protein
VDLAAQAAPGYGAAGTRPPERHSRSRRNLCGRRGKKGKWGREVESKAIIAIAAEQDGKGVGRIRLRRIADVSAGSLPPFVREAVVPGAHVHTGASA